MIPAVLTKDESSQYRVHVC